MTPVMMENAAKQVRLSNLRRLFPDLRVGFNNLMVHRLRSLLTMLGMIFGVAAVVSMLSIATVVSILVGLMLMFGLGIQVGSREPQI